MKKPAVLALILLGALALFAVGPALATEVAPTAADDIRDIRPPLHLPPRTAWEPYALAGLGLALAVAGGALYWQQRRRRRRRPATPWDVALRQLAEAVRLQQPENAYAFSIAVSEALRAYLEKRFGIPMLHRTTPEFLADLADESAAALRPWHASLRTFLSHCDMAKFARWSLTEDEMLALYVAAKDLVEATRPASGPSPLARARGRLLGAFRLPRPAAERS